MAQRKQTFIICRSQIQQDATWNFLCTCHQMGIRGGSEIYLQLGLHAFSKNIQPKEVEKLLFHRVLEGILEQFFIWVAKQWNLCFRLHLSLLLLQQTIKAKLKEDWGKNCHKTVLHWLRGSRESHRPFPPVFSAVFMKEDSWHLFNETPLCLLKPFTVLKWGRWKRSL